MLDDLYDSHEAARYLGISINTLKYHVHTMGNLAPAKIIGHSMVFTKEQLDEFKRTKRSVGRPPRRET